MKLKDAGHILRTLAETWREQGELADTDTDIGRGYASAQRNHAKALIDILDTCGVPQRSGYIIEKSEKYEAWNIYDGHDSLAHHTDTEQEARDLVWRKEQEQ